MTLTQLRQSDEYAKCIHKIKGYSAGFTFTVPYYKMTKGQRESMRIVLGDAQVQGLIESTSINLSLEGDVVSETFRRLP